MRKDVNKLFEVNPNGIYCAKDLTEISGFGKSTIYEWFKSGLVHFDAPGGKATTGRAILNFFEQQSNKDEQPSIEELPLKVQMRLDKAGY